MTYHSSGAYNPYLILITKKPDSYPAFWLSIFLSGGILANAYP